MFKHSMLDLVEQNGENNIQESLKKELHCRRSFGQKATVIFLLIPEKI